LPLTYGTTRSGERVLAALRERLRHGDLILQSLDHLLTTKLDGLS
jgi:hypothetical protein